MSSPQPPDGSQQGSAQDSAWQPYGNAPEAGADSTQMISSRMDPQQADADSTQMVSPDQQVAATAQGSDSTQVVPPSMQPPPQPMYEQPAFAGQESTQLVNPAMQPPSQPMYGQPGQPVPAAPPGTPGAGFPAAGGPPPGYGQPQQPGFAPPGMPPGPPPGRPVEWGTRVLGALIDQAPPMLLMVIAVIVFLWVSFVGGSILLLLFGLLAAPYAIWNSGYLQGTTGQSLGKKVAKTKLISEETGQPVGFGNAFLRQLCHALDALPLYIGFLAPLWDAKNQTWADNIMKTIVVPADGAMIPGGYPSGPGGGFGAPPQPGQLPPGYPQPGQPSGFGAPPQPGQPPQGMPPGPHTGGFAPQQPGGYGVPPQPGQPQPGGYPQGQPQPPGSPQPGQPPQQPGGFGGPPQQGPPQQPW